MTKTLILPIAGRSSRFPNSKPKWMFIHPNGKFMLINAVMNLPLTSFDSIVVVLLREHEQTYKCVDAISRQFKELGYFTKLKFVILDNPTKSQSETVVKAIEELKIEGQIVIKDCDNSFYLGKIPDGNFVGYSKLSEVGYIKPANKSYVRFNDDNTINTIVEKEVISNFFCCGIYVFENAHEFRDKFYKLEEAGLVKELYISYIILSMLFDRKHFQGLYCNQYTDWGELEDWKKFQRQYQTIFCDLDGVLLRNRGEYTPYSWGTGEPIYENIQYLRQLHTAGKAYIIITTSRPESYRELTINELNKHDIPYNQIIFSLPHNIRRVLINDFSLSNGYRGAECVNIPRDNDNLSEYMEGLR